MSGGLIVQMGYFQFGGSTVIVVFQQVSSESLHFICSVWLASHVVRIVCVLAVDVDINWRHPVLDMTWKVGRHDSHHSFYELFMQSAIGEPIVLNEV